MELDKGGGQMERGWAKGVRAEEGNIVRQGGLTWGGCKWEYDNWWDGGIQNNMVYFIDGRGGGDANGIQPYPAPFYLAV
jgi:hypothetical protein